VAVAGVLLVVAGCSSGGTHTSSSLPSPNLSGSPASSTSTTQSSAAALHILGIGDSYMSAQDSHGHTFMDVFATELESSTGAPVDLRVLTGNDATSRRVREQLAKDAGYRAAVSEADVIVLSVGGNDTDPFGVFPKGTCSRDQPAAACLAAYDPELSHNYEAILTSIESLRAGKPTAIRVTSMDNPFVGWSEAPTPAFGRDFFAHVARAETNAIFAVAAKHGAKSVDFLRVFGGRDGTHDPARYLAPDHAHPGDLGIATIASLLTALGVSASS
jgi:lysophospholipase L1-like esterase